jgi:hypothetical protein
MRAGLLDGVRTRPRLILVAAIAMLGAIAIGLTVNQTSARASGSQTVTVNFASTTGPVTGAGSGFLYGLSQDGTQPPDYLLAPLNPTSARGGGASITGNGWYGDGYTDGTGFQARMTSIIAQATRLSTPPYDGKYDVLLSDIWGPGSDAPEGMLYPCNDGNCSNWVTFVDDVVTDLQNAGLGNDVRYDIWNEPDNSAFYPPGYNTTQYYEMWNAAVNEIRSLQSNAVIVGPSVSNFNTTYLSEFLSTVKADGTVPNVLNWHFSGNPISDAQTEETQLSTDGITGVSLSMNEYLVSAQENAGQEAWYVDQIAKSDLSSASHGIWGSCCTTGNLDGILGTNGSGTLVPTAQWWVYDKYAQMTGELASVTNSGGTTDAAAAEDSTRDLATVLLGDSAGNTGTVTLNLDGLSSMSWLEGSSGIEVNLERIPDSGSNQLPQPSLVTQEVVANGTSSVTLPINWAAANDAYFVTLTPANLGSTATIASDDTTDGPNYFQYGANWGTTGGISGTYNGTVDWSYTPGSTSLVHFEGNQLVLYGIHDVDQGEFGISIDGSAPVTIDDYASTRNPNAILYTSPVLDPGPHTATITVLSTKDPSSSGYNVAFTRVDVLQGTREDANATSGPATFSYSSGGWCLASGIADMFDGTANCSYTGGATATITFTGTEIGLHAVNDVDQGYMDIAVDGGTPVQIDDYAPIRNATASVWNSGFLTSGSHTVTITVTGTHDSNSSGNNIALDSVDVFTSAQ